MRLPVLIMLMLTVPLPGCTALMVGGEKSGTYQATADRSDAAITSAIRARYASDAAVSPYEIGVHTQAGAVTLSGRVASSDARRHAESIARAAAGVRSVSNLIVVE